MSYTRPLTPRFYVDNVNWCLANGQIATGDITLNFGAMNSGSSILNLFDMNPANRASFDTSGDPTTHINFDIDFTDNIDVNFMAILNHNLHTANGEINVSFNGGGNSQSGLTHRVNSATGGVGGSYVDPPADGDTIFFFDTSQSKSQFTIDIADDSNFSATDLQIGCILLGKYHDVSHRAEVGIPRPIDYGNTVRTSQGGKSYSNMQWDKASYSPFRGSAAYRQSGKLGLDMTYKYINDTELIRSDLSASTDDSSFLHDVKNKTFGDHIPLIFTGDSTSTIDGDYLFCRMVKSEITESQTPNVMNLTVQLIEEF